MDKERVSKFFRAAEGYIKTDPVSDDTLEMLINDLQDLEREEWDITQVVIDVMAKARFDRSINMEPSKIYDRVKNIIIDEVTKEHSIKSNKYDRFRFTYVLPFLKESEKAKIPVMPIFANEKEEEEALLLCYWLHGIIPDEEFYKTEWGKKFQKLPQRSKTGKNAYLRADD